MASQAQVIDGRYRLVAQIGQGGMARIYRAYDLKMGRVIALKVLRPEFARSQQVYNSFSSEAKAAARLDNNHVIRVYDWGIDRSIGWCYITMEYVPGRNLRQVLGQGAFTVPLAAQLAYDVSDALTVAHERGIVHSDVKPANVMITQSGRAKIGDFGIARIRSAHHGAGPVLAGTIQYMSPEQMEGRPATPAGDLFSLGVTLYELCAGRPPYVSMATPDANVLRRWLLHHPVPSRHNPQVDDNLDAIVRKAMDPNPDRRYRTAIEMREALGGYLRTHPAREGEGVAGPGNPLAWSLAFVSSNGAMGHAHAVDKTVVLGSGPGSDLRIGSRSLAERHARFAPVGNLLHVSNLGPAGSLAVNAHVVERAYCTLGDVVMVGGVRLKVGCSQARHKQA